MIKFTLTSVELTEKRSKLLRRTNFITAADRLKDDWMFGEYSVNLFSMSFEVQSGLLYWPYNGLCVGKSSESAESPWTVTKKSEKIAEDVHCSRGHVWNGRETSFSCSRSRFCGPVLFCHFVLLSLSFFVVAVSFFVFLSYCLCVFLFWCRYFRLLLFGPFCRVTQCNPKSEALRDGNSPEACETFKKQVYHLGITQGLDYSLLMKRENYVLPKN